LPIVIDDALLEIVRRPGSPKLGPFSFTATRFFVKQRLNRSIKPVTSIGSSPRLTSRGEGHRQSDRTISASILRSAGGIDLAKLHEQVPDLGIILAAAGKQAA